MLGALQRRVGAGHQALAELLDLDALEQDLVDATSDKLNAKHVTKALASNPPLSWREVVENDTSKRLDDLDERARTLLTERGVGPVRNIRARSHGKAIGGCSAGSLVSRERSFTRHRPATVT